MAKRRLKGHSAFTDPQYRTMYKALARKSECMGYDPRCAYMACRGMVVGAEGRSR